MATLGVNIDHVATVRQARMITEPDPVHAAALAELGGATCITVHLREDRRHIQDRDVRILRETIKTKLNLEMACSEEIIKIATQVKPHQSTLVPEKRQELTTEGGLDVAGNFNHVRDSVKKLRDAGITVSLFIDADEKQITASKNAGAEFIEIHTGRYADALAEKQQQEELDKIIRGAELALKTGLRVNAGHGLNYRNVQPIARIEKMEELNIGHSIVARAVFVGMLDAVREMVELIKCLS